MNPSDKKIKEILMNYRIEFFTFEELEEIIEKFF